MWGNTNAAPLRTLILVSRSDPSAERTFLDNAYDNGMPRRFENGLTLAEPRPLFVHATATSLLARFSAT
jgi:hypothetical protein